MESSLAETLVKIDQEDETTSIMRTRTMNEIIKNNSNVIIKQVDPSVPCLRSSLKNIIDDEEDVVASILKRTQTMDEIIASNADLIQKDQGNSNHFLRSLKSKNLNESDNDDEFRPIKRTRTINDVINANPPSQNLNNSNHNLRSSQDCDQNSDHDSNVQHGELLTRTKTMNEIMSCNNLDLYQYLNETEHYLRSSKQNLLKLTEETSTAGLDSNVPQLVLQRTRTLNEITDKNNEGLLLSNQEDSYHLLRNRKNIYQVETPLSSSAKSNEWDRLNEEYIDLQIQFNGIRRKELGSLLGVLTKSRLSHKKLMRETNESLADITALGQGSSHMARKLELFRWLNRESVNRCQGLIKEAIEMDKQMLARLDKVENLFSVPANISTESISNDDPQNSEVIKE